MSHIHVCLVSEQTIPNILGICHFRPDRLLFITTQKMEKLNKTMHILDTLITLNLDYSSCNTKIVVQEDSLLDCKKQLDNWITGKEGLAFSVNLTGGTKMMSIAAYEHFKDYGSTMIYIPVGNNDFITPFPKKAVNKHTALDIRLKVPEYLAAYGVTVVNANKLDGYHAVAVKRKEFSKWIVTNYEVVKPLLERLSQKLRAYRDEAKGYKLSTAYVPVSAQEVELLDRIGFEKEKDAYTKHMTKSEINFITGGWLEEFCYNEVLQYKGRGIDDVVMGVIAVNSGGRKNEFDIMFSKDNALYTVECKSLDQNDDKKTDALYKIAALQKEFGLRVESFFVSTSPHILREGKLKLAVQARAEQFKTVVIPPQDVINFAEKVAFKLHLDYRKECNV